MEKAFENKEEVKGIIISKCKGGFIVNVDSCLCFLPASQLDLRPLKNTDHLMKVPQTFECVKLDKKRGNIVLSRRSILERAQGNIAGDLRARRFRAEGGSMKEPVAKKTMPLLDMDGQEMDLRAEGGFVPIGRMEKADDVPARLSKNEFVFTADAVRNAGDGNVDKGAEVMYNMMKNLEAGGEVSEESQGLKGARKMFQTSQRLEEVL